MSKPGEIAARCRHLPGEDAFQRAVSYLRGSGLLTPEAEQEEVSLRLVVEDLFRIAVGEEPLEQ